MIALSPLLSNVMLDDLDWELERRGHRFVRYADDVTIYVKSERAGQRVMESVSQYVERRLKLKVNRQKTAVDLAKKRRLLGFRFYGRERKVKVRIDPDARKRAKDRLRLDLAQVGRLDGAADPRDQPLHGRLDELLRASRHALSVRGPRRMAPQVTAASSLEGMDAPEN